MALKLYEENDIQAIADAIRVKNGGSDTYTVDAMAEAIENLQNKDIMPPAELPDYVRQETARVAAECRKHITDESIVAVAISDTHYFADETPSSQYANTDTGDIHASMAIKALSYLLPIDFVTHLGDFCIGTSNTNLSNRKKQIEKCEKYLIESAGDLPKFFCIGNHDTGTYQKTELTPGTYLYQHFTAHSASNDTVFSGEANGGYCYRDFSDKKLRVIMLNTSEQLLFAGSYTAPDGTVKWNYNDIGTTVAQQKWAANVLLNLAAKTDAAEWRFIVLSHYALDYGDARAISNVFGAYVNGDSLTIDGTTFNFDGHNSPKFLCQMHGHFHCFKSARLNSHYNYAAWSDPMEEYDAWRICTPNASYGMENSYQTPYYGITFGEDTSYPKTVDDAEDTSFVINIINPSDETIYSVHYGAGYDRTISLAGVSYYSVTVSAVGATVSSSATTIAEGDSYSGTITLNEGYTLDSVTVTMGGVDITSTAYSNNTITIAEVTGDISITVATIAPLINLIRTATTADGTAIYGEDYNNDGTADGYKKGVFLGSSGEVSTSNFANGYATGYIPFSPQIDTITIKNIGVSQVYYTDSRVQMYSNSSGGVVTQLLFKNLTPNSDGDYVITPAMWSNPPATAKFRVSGSSMDDTTAIYIS